jgi:hypothetical protein
MICRRDELEAFEDASYDLIDALIKACVVAAPVESMMQRNKLGNDALYSIILAMACGMMESDTIDDNRHFIGNPVAEWIPWANAIRDEINVYEEE